MLQLIIDSPCSWQQKNGHLDVVNRLLKVPAIVQSIAVNKNRIILMSIQHK
jgi:hypothetical protein